MDKDVQDKLVQDVADLKTGQATIQTNMEWVKKMLSNHYAHHEKIIIGLILAVAATAGSLVIVLMER